MNKQISKSVAVAVIAAILVFLGWFVFFGDTFVRQARRMKLAREYLPGITNVVRSYPEFRDVTVGVGTGAGGCFLVVGLVEDDKQLQKLESTIAATKPPVTVLYRVQVLTNASDTKP